MSRVSETGTKPTSWLAAESSLNRSLDRRTIAQGRFVIAHFRRALDTGKNSAFSALNSTTPGGCAELTELLCVDVAKGNSRHLAV